MDMWVLSISATESMRHNICDSREQVFYSDMKGTQRIGFCKPAKRKTKISEEK